ncbi:MAG TPA: hypothetical protein VGV38_11725, partial [Pyrinomonadaceae bacterium]|nr:hypothetical protein [Pyrinomonadaceae bacterium]
MAKAILACHRSLPQRQLERLVRASAERLVPAGLGGPRLRQLSCAGLALAVVNPPQSMPAEGCSVCVGQMCGPRANWQTPGADAPDGTYAIFRVNADSVEVLTDCAGTRSVWYYHDEEWFIAANSQRAIISILGSFRLNPEAVTWMLSAGSLGPAGSWDERVRRMPADARLRFDRATWELQESSAPAVFNPARYRDEEAATAEVRRVLEDACWGFDVPEHEWRIALSGGYDSRMLLAFLKEKRAIDCVTWGAANALDQPGSDPDVARRVAHSSG